METWFIFASLAITLYAAFLILIPFLAPFVLALMFTLIFRPMYRKMSVLFNSEFFSALLTVIICAFVVMVPLVFFGMRIFGEAKSMYTSLSAAGNFDLGAFNFSFNFNDYAQKALSWIIQNFGAFFSGVAQILFGAFLSLLGLFYFLKDGARLKRWIIDVIPLTEGDTEEILHQLEAIVSSVVKGILLVALLHGIIMGIGFEIFGIPHAAFWGALIVFTSFIPLVGLWLVVIPAIAYLFITNQIIVAVGLLLWSVILMNIIDNMILPQLMRRGVQIHPMLILLSILGGIGFCGPIGFLVGPLVMALLFALLKIYRNVNR